MATLEQFELDYIRSNDLKSQQTRDLLNAKKEALQSLQSQQSTSLQSPNPKLTPGDDLRIDTPSRSTGLDKGTYVAFPISPSLIFLGQINDGFSF